MYFWWEEEVKQLTPQQLKSAVDRMLVGDSQIAQLHTKTKVPIKFRDCDNGIRALYNIKKREIWVDPSVKNESELREALLHEFIHAADHKGGLDISTLDGLARSEVHAAKYCECKSAFFKRRCVKNVAKIAVTNSIGDYERASQAVDSVFEDAFADSLF